MTTINVSQPAIQMAARETEAEGAGIVRRVAYARAGKVAGRWSAR
jgi:hypothetical protein